MLALTVSLLFALYIFGPDAFSRFILDFSVPRRAVTLSRSEEVYRAVIWATFATAAAYLWARWTGTLARVWRWSELQTFFSGIYSEQFFRDHRQEWFGSAGAFAWMNWCLLWRLYTVVFCLSLVLCLAIHYYAALRYRLAGKGRLSRYARNTLAAVVLPRIAPWHLLLSRIYVRDRGARIHLDVLTKMNILYQGRFVEKALAADGTLVNLTLATPQRFRRSAYEADRLAGREPSADLFWRKIPSDTFVLTGSEIHSINIRYLAEVATLKKRPLSRDLVAELRALRRDLDQLKFDQPDIDESGEDGGSERQPAPHAG